MAIEKMKLLNIVVEKKRAHDVLKDVALMEKMHLINALVEINESNFKMKVDEAYIDEVAELCLIDAFSEKKDYKSIRDKLYRLMEYMQIEKELDKTLISHDFDFDALHTEITKIYDELSHIRERIDTLEQEKKRLDSMSILEGIYEDAVDFKQLNALEFFDIKFGTLSKENMERLIRNYDNIYAAVMHVGKKGTQEIYVIVSMKELSLENDRILRSVYFEEVELLEEYLDTPSKMLHKINERLLIVNQELEGLHMRAEVYDETYGNRIKICYAHLMLELKIERMKKLLAVTNNYVYISGWVSEADLPEIELSFESYDNEIVLAETDLSEVSAKLKPPTKLRNHWLFKPFETLVYMYGTPSYTEVDPTAFVGMAYMFLFGAMFGDLGQGLLLVLFGWLMTRKNKANPYGGILKRIGLFSMVFGFFYDSLFGYEHVISKIFPEHLAEKMFLRPIEHINEVLLLAVVTGLIFLMISYGYSIVNKLKNNDLKEGVFGRNGITGVVLFLSILLLAGGQLLGWQMIPTTLLKVLIGASVLVMVIREPLANAIQKKKPLYHETPSAYYVESGFELLETFLGMLSNSVSFIRVGAFALNHVGLFMAFHTIASLMGSAMGEVTMFIVGNALVIGLEGLIVLIQGLRLVYYEMFSKYYEGEGMAFEAAEVENIGGKR